MSFRYMRMIIFFDLPSTTYQDGVEYRKFRKFLINNGFIMMQESIYTKLVINNNSTKVMKTLINKNLPHNGLVQLLEVTERQFASIEYLVGKSSSNIIDTTERVTIL